MVRFAEEVNSGRSSVFGTHTFDFDYVLGIYRGEYNDYGDLEEREDAPDDLLFFSSRNPPAPCIDLRNTEFYLFVRESVWNRVVKEYPADDQALDHYDRYVRMSWLWEHLPPEQQKTYAEIAPKRNWTELTEKLWKHQERENEAHRRWNEKDGVDHHQVFTREQWEERWKEVQASLPPRQARILERQELKELSSVAFFCYSVRRNFFGTVAFRGHQTGWDTDTERRYRLVMSEERRIYNEQRRERLAESRDF
jgi:hypothetical protein